MIFCCMSISPNRMVLCPVWCYQQNDLLSFVTKKNTCPLSFLLHQQMMFVRFSMSPTEWPFVLSMSPNRMILCHMSMSTKRMILCYMSPKLMTVSPTYVTKWLTLCPYCFTNRLVHCLVCITNRRVLVCITNRRVRCLVSTTDWPLVLSVTPSRLIHH